MNNKLPKILEYLLPISVCFIGLHFTILGICHYDLSRIPGDLGDARFNMYLLEHGYQYITHQVHYFWGAPFFYPFSPAIAFSDNLLGSMPVYAIFRLLACDRETSFQLWFIVVCILNFFSAFYVLRRLTNHAVLACIGAYIFAFSIFILCQFHHAQTFPRFITPMVIYWMIRYFDNFKLKFFWLMIIGIAFQFYCGMYLGIYLAMVCFVLFLVLLVVNYRDALTNRFFSGANLYKLALPITVFVLLLFPITIHYWNVYSGAEIRTFKDTFLTLPTIQSFFFSNKASIVWRMLSTLCIRPDFAWYDQQLFVGIIPWLGLVAAISYFFKKDFIQNNRALFSIICTLIFCIFLTIRIGDFSIFKWLYKLPGFSAMGTVPRIMNMFLLFFAMIPCLFLNSIIKQRRTLWFSILLIAVIAENSTDTSYTNPFNKKDAQARVTPIVEQLKTVNWEGKKAFAYMPKTGNDFEVQLDGMLASQIIHKPCVNGYSATSPYLFDGFWRMFNEEALNAWLDYNHIDHGTIVQIH